VEEADLILFFIDGSNLSNSEEVASSIKNLLQDPNITEKKIVFFINKNVGVIVDDRIWRGIISYSIKTSSNCLQLANI